MYLRKSLSVFFTVFSFCLFVLFICSSSFSDSLESSSNHSCIDTPTTNFCRNFSHLTLVVAMHMVTTAHAYYIVQYGRILHSCTLILRTLRI